MNISATGLIQKAVAAHSNGEDLFAQPPCNNQVSSSDDELVARSRQGDNAAFEELVTRHQDKLFRLVMRFVRNEADAHEVLQEVFLCAWRNLQGFEGRAQVSSWLHRVTVNAALMFLRSRNRRPVTVSASSGMTDLACSAEYEGRGAALDQVRRPDEQIESLELRRRIQRAVNRLPPSLSVVFFEREVEGYSTQQTADALGLSPPAVKTRLHRARSALRQDMQRYLDQ